MSAPTFDISLVLNVANFLNTHGDASEECVRSIVNRSYYAAFHSVKKHLIHLNPNLLPLKWQHLAVWKLLMKETDPDWFVVGNLGIGLNLKRNSADYDKPPASFGAASDAINDANDIIRAVSAITVPPSTVFRPHF